MNCYCHYPKDTSQPRRKPQELFIQLIEKNNAKMKHQPMLKSILRSFKIFDKLVSQRGQAFSQAPQEYQILGGLALPVSMQLPAQ